MYAGLRGFPHWVQKEAGLPANVDPRFQTSRSEERARMVRVFEHGLTRRGLRAADPALEREASEPPGGGASAGIYVAATCF